MIFSASGLQADLNWDGKSDRSMSIYSQDYLSQSNHADSLAKRIHTRTGVYSGLLYTEIILSLLISAGYGVFRVSIVQLVITGIALVSMLGACLTLIVAKMQLSLKLQKIGLVSVAVGTVFSIVSCIIYLIEVKENTDGLQDFNEMLYDDLSTDAGKKAIMIVAILEIFIQFGMGLALTLSARVVTRLLSEREKILEDLSVKKNASVVAVL